MATTSIVREFRKQPRQAARCCAGKAQLTKKRTHGYRRNGFLNRSFGNIYGFEGDISKAEQGFFNSAENICLHYELTMPQTLGLHFPENASQVFVLIAKELRSKHQLECRIVTDDLHGTTITTLDHFGTGTRLYYIPIRGLCRWSAAAEKQAEVRIIQYIFAYLYQVVKVPFYTESDSFLLSEYEMIDDMLMNDDSGDADEDDIDKMLNEIADLKSHGASTVLLIAEPQLLENPDFSLCFDKELNDMGLAFRELHKDYPIHTIFDNIHPALYENEGDRIYIEQYISFYWSGNDGLSDMLDDSVNCIFQETGIMEEPIHLQWFDNLPIKQPNTFDFERRFFDLLERLCSYLHEIDE